LIERSCSLCPHAVERSFTLKPCQRRGSSDVCGATQHKDDAISTGIDGISQPSRLGVLCGFALISYFRVGLTFLFAFAVALDTYEGHRFPPIIVQTARDFHRATMIASAPRLIVADKQQWLEIFNRPLTGKKKNLGQRVLGAHGLCGNGEQRVDLQYSGGRPIRTLGYSTRRELALSPGCERYIRMGRMYLHLVA
jgi:hypothetical protein